MLNNKNIDVFFLLTVFLIVVLYIFLTGFNLLRFYSLNPLSVGVGTYERLFRFIVSGENICNCPYSLCFPWAESLLMPLVFLGSYFFYSIFWLINGLLKFPITFSQLLLVAQPLFFLLPAIILYRLANVIIKDRRLAFVITFSYLANQLVFIGSSLGFIFTCIGLPLLMLESYFIFNNKFKNALIFTVLVNATRVDLIVVNIIFGIILVSFYKEFRRYGRHILVISILWLIILRMFVVPGVDLANFHSSQYGATFREAFAYLIAHPLDMLNLIWRQLPKLIMVYIIHPLFLPLFSWPLLLPLAGTIPVLIFRTDTMTYFVNLAFVYLAAVFAIKVLILKYKTHFFRNFLIISIILSSSLSHYFYRYRFIDYSVGVIPFSRGFSIRSNFPTKRNKLGLKIIQSIPPDSSCFTIAPLAQRMGHLRRVGIYGITPLDSLWEWDYYLFSLKDLEFAGWNFDYQDYIGTIQAILESQDYIVEVYQNDWLLLKRGEKQHIDTEVVGRVLEKIKNLIKDIE